MNKHILSIIMGSALVLPMTAMAAPTDDASTVTPADKMAMPVDNTLQAKIQGPDGELLATQPAVIEKSMKMDEDSEAALDTNLIIDADMNDGMSGNETDVVDAMTPRTPQNMQKLSMQKPSMQMQGTQALNMQHSEASYQPLIVGERSADKESTDAAITLQEKKKDKRGELLATQPADIEFKESRRIAASR